MLIDGKAIAKQIEREIAEQVAQCSHRQPCLAVILVGKDPASSVYVNMKKRACGRAGMLSQSIELSEHTSEQALLETIDSLNRDPKVDGILVQLPLPKQMSEVKVINAIDPDKDVDGFHPINKGKLLNGDPTGFVACTPLGVKVLLERVQIDLDGKHVVIIGRSNIVGKPLAAALIQRGSGADATVTVCHRRSKNMKELCQQADVIIPAVGMPRLIQADWVKEGAVVVDIGINRIEDPQHPKGYYLVGDADFESLKEKCSAITPVPGGVGPMTVAMLLHNTLLSYRRREEMSNHRLSITS